MPHKDLIQDHPEQFVEPDTSKNEFGASGLDFIVSRGHLEFGVTGGHRTLILGLKNGTVDSEAH